MHIRCRTPLAILLLATAAQVLALPRIATYDFGGRCIAVPELAMAIHTGGVPAVTDPSGSSVPNVALSNTNLIRTLEFYEQVLGLNTANLYPLVSLATNFSDAGDECSSGNAFFDPELALLGVLQGKPEQGLLVAADLDVLGHEFTHGVVTSTVGLQGDCEIDGRNEAGALEESIADIIGMTLRMWVEDGKQFQSRFDDTDFDIGVNAGRLNGLRVTRSASHPAEMGNTDYYAEWAAPCDGPHRNSTVSTLAYQLLVRGGRHPTGKSDLDVRGIGLEPAVRLVYYVLHHRLISAWATIPDFASAMALAARKLHGPDSAEYKSVLDAFSAVGVDMTPSYQTASDGAVVSETAPAPVPAPVPAPRIGPVLLALLVAITVLPFLLLQRLSGTQPAPSRSTMPRDAARKDGAPHHAGRAAAHCTVVAVLPDGDRVAITLGSNPVVLGREGAGIPVTLARLLARDPSLSRQHCEMWFNPERNAVYFRNLSPNSTTINGHRLDVGEKGSVGVSTHVQITMGRTEFSLELGKPDHER